MTKQPPVLQYEKVLVVDDIQKWLNVARDNLVYYGCPLERIATTKDVEEGFRAYKKTKPTIIITDINFDKENLEDTQGCDYIRRIRADSYAGAIIAMSSLTDIEEKTKKAGADYFINKRKFTEGFDGFIEFYLEKK